MAKAFSTTEKEGIKEQLMQAGRERFARYGPRKTNVEELTRDVGISKGAFYAFFESKEELYFEVMERVEAEIQERLLGAARTTAEPGKEGIKRFLVTALDILKAHPFFANTDTADYQYIVRKMPEERMLAGIKSDEAYAARLLAAWEERGVRVQYDARLVSSLLRALVFVTLHEDDFAPDVYPQMMDLLIDSLAERLGQDK